MNGIGRFGLVLFLTIISINCLAQINPQYVDFEKLVIITIIVCGVAGSFVVIGGD